MYKRQPQLLPYGALPDGTLITQYVLSAGGLTARIINYGGILTDLIACLLYTSLDLRAIRAQHDRAPGRGTQICQRTDLALQRGVDSAWEALQAHRVSAPVHGLRTKVVDANVGWSEIK